jgi:hypothetical protein
LRADTIAECRQQPALAGRRHDDQVGAETRRRPQDRFCDGALRQRQGEVHGHARRRRIADIQQALLHVDAKTVDQCARAGNGELGGEASIDRDQRLAEPDVPGPGIDKSALTFPQE